MITPGRCFCGPIVTVLAVTIAFSQDSRSPGVETPSRRETRAASNGELEWVGPLDWQNDQGLASGQHRWYRGHAAIDGRLVLDANNGFFDRAAFHAEIPSPVPPSQRDLISSHFRWLVARGKEVTDTARWHFWFTRPGTVHVRLYFDVPAEAAGTHWQMSLGDHTHSFRSQVTRPDMPQPQTFQFHVDRIGKYTLAIGRNGAEKHATKIARIELTGPAISGAHLLRARWRPAAIHTRYQCTECPETSLWVFETQSLSPRSSYSPMTTRFGYYGGTFNELGRASGLLNFSMWAAGRNATTAPSLSEMPHLLATGNRNAVFGGFGHEGSGVKIRNWEPIDGEPQSIIQALRVQSDASYDTYSGYFYDQTDGRWVLFATGRKPRDPKRTDDDSPTTLRVASFCEIPGPPDRERSGDRQRVIRRRGWYYGTDLRWHPVDQQTTSRKPKSPPINQSIGTDDGWFLMATGGMEMFDPVDSVSIRNPQHPHPQYLTAEKTADLFRGPVEFGDATVSDVGSDRATIQFHLGRIPAGAHAKVYYGPVDCITFVPRTLHGTEKSEVSESMLAENRTWAFVSAETDVVNGTNRIQLTNLKPKSVYHFRVYVEHDGGKSWDFHSGQFQTR